MTVAQNNIVDGVYDKQPHNGDYVSIQGNKFYYIQWLGWQNPFFENDTMAWCTFRRVDEQFIELNSFNFEEDYKYFVEKTKIAQSYDSTIADGLIKIRIFNDHNYPEHFGIYTYDADSSYLNSKKGECLLAKNFSKFSFVIYSGFVPHKYLLMSLGLHTYRSPEYIVEDGCNTIDIQISVDVCYKYFDSYYVKGQYARIHNDTIYWNGDIYKYVKKRKIKKIS